MRNRSPHIRIARAVTTLVIVAAPLGAFAQETVAAAETDVTGGTLMLVAYLALWAMMLGYLFVLARRQQGLDRDLVELERRLDEILQIDEPAE